MAARKTRGVTLEEIRRWPAAVDVTRAAEALGVSRSTLYAALARGEHPVATVQVGHRMRVLTHSLIVVLEGTGSTAASA